MLTVLRQSLAFAAAEWRRQLTAPVWAALLLLWSLVSAVLLLVILHHAAGTPYAPGETAMSLYFRMGNLVLALMLVVFTPLLCLDTIAGRRESGRLEHLLIAGLSPGALVLGGFLATCASLAVLALPPTLIHLCLSVAGASSWAHFVGGCAALLGCAAALAALTLACSAWAPSRTMAALGAATLGLFWWLFDLLPGAQSLPGAISLGSTLRHWAGGLIDLRTALGLLLVCCAALAAAVSGVTWDHARLRRGLVLPAWLLAVGLLLPLSSGLGGTIALGASPAALSPGTQAAFATLSAKEPVQAWLIASPGMGQDLLDGPLREACRAALQQLGGSVRWQAVDPEFDRRFLAGLRERVQIRGEDLAHPLLVLEHADRQVVLALADLAHTEASEQGLRLHSLRTDAALAGAVQILGGGLPRVGWVQDLGCRLTQSALPDQREQAIGAWRRAWAAAGSRGGIIGSPALAEQELDLAVLAGPSQDPSAKELTALAAALDRGRTVLIALDGRRRGALPGLERFLSERGITVGPGVLHGQAQATQEPLILLHPPDDGGPAALAAQARKRLHASWCVPLRAETDALPGWRSHAVLALPGPLWQIGSSGASQPVQTQRLLLAESVKNDSGRLVVLATVDAFSDGGLDQGGNRLLARGLFAWLTQSEAAAAESGEDSRLCLDDATATMLRWAALLVLPTLALALGGTTWWWRRRA